MEVSRTEYTIKRAKELYGNGKDMFIAIDNSREEYEEIVKNEYFNQYYINNDQFYNRQNL